MIPFLIGVAVGALGTSLAFLVYEVLTTEENDGKD